MTRIHSTTRTTHATHDWGPSTLAIHGRGWRRKAHHAVTTPIIQTSNYSFESTSEVFDFMQAKSQGRIIRAILFSTGMSAVILTLMAYMRKDGHILLTSDCYRQTRDFATNLLAKFGIQTSLVEPTAAAIEQAIRLSGSLQQEATTAARRP